MNQYEKRKLRLHNAAIPKIRVLCKIPKSDYPQSVIRACLDFEFSERPIPIGNNKENERRNKIPFALFPEYARPCETGRYRRGLHDIHT